MDSIVSNPFEAISAVSQTLENTERQFLVNGVILRKQNTQRVPLAKVYIQNGFNGLWPGRNEVSSKDGSQGIVKMRGFEGLVRYAVI
jgi:hypothetical protein